MRCQIAKHLSWGRLARSDRPELYTQGFSSESHTQTRMLSLLRATLDTRTVSKTNSILDTVYAMEARLGSGSSFPAPTVITEHRKERVESENWVHWISYEELLQNSQRLYFWIYLPLTVQIIKQAGHWEREKRKRHGVGGTRGTCFWFIWDCIQGLANYLELYFQNAQSKYFLLKQLRDENLKL